MTYIQTLTAREILDSRGNPTIEVACTLQSGARGVASVPSGASTGIHEAHERRDGDTARYHGQGVLGAVQAVHTEIADALKGHAYGQRTLDTALCTLDGSPDKSRFGANALLGVSLAFARASAQEQGIELYRYIAQLADTTSVALPHPALNVINGGKHADSGLAIQECMIIPMGFDSFQQKIQAGAEIIAKLKHILHAKGYSTSVGDEGGFAPKLGSSQEALDAIVEAISAAGYTHEQVRIGIDAAASSFYVDGAYHIDGGVKTSEEMIAWYSTLCDTYPIISIEDGLAEDDWEGFTSLTKQLGDRVTIVGDDLTVTNVARIQIATQQKAINAVLIKLNQIGTLTETIDAVALTKKEGWMPFVSHRSGETTDTFIADLAVGLSCPYIKAGSLVRGERVCKYNRLLEIEENMNRT